MVRHMLIDIDRHHSQRIRILTPDLLLVAFEFPQKPQRPSSVPVPRPSLGQLPRQSMYVNPHTTALQLEPAAAPKRRISFQEVFTPQRSTSPSSGLRNPHFDNELYMLRKSINKCK